MTTTLVKKNSITTAAALLILFLIGVVVVLSYPQLYFPAYAVGTTSCIDYDRTENTITISCDHASFRDVANTINNPAIIANLGSGEYLLNGNLQVDDDATLSIGPADVIKWLKITGANGIIVNGRIEIDGVKITSWDTQTDSPVFQTSTGSIPRAFINLRGSEAGFIQDSEIAYLGDAESPRRGIDLGEGGGGSHDFAIRNSKIHDNWMGFYSAGGYNIIIDGNEFYNNIKYAIDPHTGTHNMTVSNNKVYDNQGIAVICSYQCYDIIYEGNEVHDNAGAGLMFSRATHDSTIRNNWIYNQFGSATPIAISESQNNKIYGNNISNSTYGISVHNPVVPVPESDGMSSDNTVYNSTFDGTSSDNTVYNSTFDGTSSGNMVYNNTFDKVQYAIRAVGSSGNTFSDNRFGTVTDSHYVMDSGASIDIENQVFHGFNVRAVSGSNTLSIRNSGIITIDNTRHHNTDLEPYTQKLSSQSIKIDSARR
jgi:mannuronan 5-epimerase